MNEYKVKLLNHNAVHIMAVKVNSNEGEYTFIDEAGDVKLIAVKQFTEYIQLVTENIEAQENVTAHNATPPLFEANGWALWDDWIWHWRGTGDAIEEYQLMQLHTTIMNELLPKKALHQYTGPTLSYSDYGTILSHEQNRYLYEQMPVGWLNQILERLNRIEMYGNGGYLRKLVGIADDLDEVDLDSEVMDA